MISYGYNLLMDVRRHFKNGLKMVVEDYNLFRNTVYISIQYVSIKGCEGSFNGLFIRSHIGLVLLKYKVNI